MYTTADVLSDASPPEPLVEAIAAIAPRPVLLIAADNIDDEVRLGTRFADTAPTTTQLWVVPDSGHTQALSTTPLEWTSRVLDLFAQALAPEPITQGPER
jgi:hypothetical protein